MLRSEKYLSITIFLFSILVFAIASGSAYVGDSVEKVLDGISVFANYFVLIALFAVFKGVSLFTSKQLLFMAFLTVGITLASYLYPYFKYSEQSISIFSSTFIYDLILNVLIFTIFFKEANK